MIRRSRESVAAARLAGLLVLLPLALAMLAYAFDLVNRLLGPGSLVGPFFAAPGYPFAGHPGWRRQLLGTIYLLGVLHHPGPRAGACAGPGADRKGREATRSGRRAAILATDGSPTSP